MRLHYFDRVEVDPDDTMLFQAKVRLQVPDGCLLGGGVVKQHLALNRNPCHSCHGPRERCGGSLRQDEAESASLAYTRALLTGEDPDEGNPLRELLKRR